MHICSLCQIWWPKATDKFQASLRKKWKGYEAERGRAGRCGEELGGVLRIRLNRGGRLASLWFAAAHRSVPATIRRPCEAGEMA